MAWLVCDYDANLPCEELLLHLVTKQRKFLYTNQKPRVASLTMGSLDEIKINETFFDRFSVLAVIFQTQTQSCCPKLYKNRAKF